MQNGSFKHENTALRDPVLQQNVLISQQDNWLSERDQIIESNQQLLDQKNQVIEQKNHRKGGKFKTRALLGFFVCRQFIAYQIKLTVNTSGVSSAPKRTSH